MWIGKFIFGAIGFAYSGLFGGLVGVFIGHLVDRRFNLALNSLNPKRQQEVEAVFFRTVFSLLGQLAKSDGRVSEQEIQHTEQVMAQMGLTPEHRSEAIRLFKEGAAPGFSSTAIIQQFNDVCGRNFNLRNMLLNYLVSLAIADGELAPGEEQVLKGIAQQLGLSGAMFVRFVDMIKAQTQFKNSSGGGNYHRPAASELETAYRALGMAPSNSDAEIKKAYRKLISENHPDKLIGQGLPEDMIKLATERSQEIQTAYDIITRHRKQ